MILILIACLCLRCNTEWRSVMRNAMDYKIHASAIHYQDHSFSFLVHQRDAFLNNLCCFIQIETQQKLKFICQRQFTESKEALSNMRICVYVSNISIIMECLRNAYCLESHEFYTSMWNKKPTSCHLVLYLFLLYKLLNMFRAILCPSSGADDLVVYLSRVV